MAGNTDTTEAALDMTSLDAASRRNIHRRLYRQECRAWLLWLLVGLMTWAYLDSVFKQLPWWGGIFVFLSAAAYSCYIAFWAVHPGQTVLSVLRKQAGPEESNNIERGFDSRWESVKDFFPLFVPVLFVVIVLMLRVLLKV